MSQHTVIIFNPENGDIVAASMHMLEEEAEKKRAKAIDAGQSAVVLNYQQLSLSIDKLRWDAERERLVRRTETLAELRLPAKQKVNEYATMLGFADIETEQGVVQADRHSYATMLEFATLIRSGVESPHAGVWRLRNNQTVPMTDEQLLAMEQAVRERNAAIMKRKWEVLDAIASETDAAKLKGFDVAAAWNEVEV